MPPTTAPMLQAAIASTGRPASSRARSAPMCAIPRAPPPDSASASRGRRGPGGAGAGASLCAPTTLAARHGSRNAATRRTVVPPGTSVYSRVVFSDYGPPDVRAAFLNPLDWHYMRGTLVEAALAWLLPTMTQRRVRAREHWRTGRQSERFYKSPPSVSAGWCRTRELLEGGEVMGRSGWLPKIAAAAFILLLASA